MSTPHDRSQQPNDDLNDPNRIVDAEQDPTTTKIERLETEANEETRFAQAEARFAHWEHEVGAERIREGDIQVGNALIHDAAGRMDDAAHVMEYADKEIVEAERLREEKRHALSRDLRKWDDQRLITLKDAVRSVRTYVMEMSDLDIRKIVRSSDFTEDEVTRKRETIIEYGQTIEITLNEFNTVRRDPFALIKELMTFTTFVYELAHYLPSLMEKLSEFGRLLLQFRF